MKQDFLQFYHINQKYLNYIRNFDKRIAMKNRPYLGIVFKNKKYMYFAPLYSTREKHNKYYTNNTYLKIFDFNNNYIGLIRFSNMIPVPKNMIRKIDYKSSSKLYQEYYLQR